MQESEMPEEAEAKSKSQIKREMHALHDLGKELVKLSPKQLDSVPLSEKTRSAIREARNFQKGALKRQLKYIGGLMQHEDADIIMHQIDLLRQPDRKAVDHLHQLERWRDALANGDEAVVEELAQQYDAFDRQYVRQLMRNTQKERDSSKPPKAYRMLFKYLSSLTEENQS